MAQNVVDFSGNPSGSGLMDDYLDKDQQNVLTSNSGIQRPSYAVAGTKWLDTSATPWLWKMYDGTNDVTLGTVNPSTHLFTPATPLTTAGDILVQGADGNLSKLAAGVEGTVLTSNGPDKIPTYKVNPIGVLTYSSSYTYKKDQIVIAVVDDETALYKSLIDDNTGNSLDDDTKWEKLALGGGGDNIGDIKYTSRTDVPNGGAWCDGAEYTQAAFPDIYQMLVDGKLSSTDYTAFENSVSTNGSCGLFALDMATTSFRVPLLKDVYIKAGNTPLAFGAESLPNITGGTITDARSNYIDTVKAPYGAFAGSAESGNTGKAQLNGENYQSIEVFSGTFDASRSSSTYQDGAKVNPDHVVYRAYVVLYSSAAEASEAQAAEFINALTDKANTDLDNVTSTGKEFITTQGKPSRDRYVNMPAEASGTTYTAPANGWVFVLIQATTSTGYANIIYGGLSKGLDMARTGANFRTIFPVKKGGTYTVGYGAATFNQHRFFYDEGVE